jgi:translation initiation factor 1A
MYQTRIHNGKKKSPKHRALIEPDDGQMYAIVQQMLGNGRVKVLCEDGKERLAKIRGSMRKYGKKTLIEKSDLVIVSERDFEDKVDLVHKYNYDEGTYLVQAELLPESIRRVWTSTSFMDDDDKKDDDYIVFGDEDTKPGGGRGGDADSDDDVDVDNM